MDKQSKQKIIEENLNKLTENQKTNKFVCQICEKIFTDDFDNSNNKVLYSEKCLCSKPNKGDEEFEKGCGRTFCSECDKKFVPKCFDCDKSLYIVICVTTNKNSRIV